MFSSKWIGITIAILLFTSIGLFQNIPTAYALPGKCYLTNKADANDVYEMKVNACEVDADCKQGRDALCAQQPASKFCTAQYELSCYKEVFGYCWCQTKDLSCENHTKDDQGKVLENQNACIQYCGSRGFKNTNWDTTRFIDRVQKSTVDGQCPEVGQAGMGAGAAKTFGGAAKVQGSSASLYNPLGNVTLQGLVARVIRAVIGIVGAIALLAFVYGGIVWMTAGGEEKRVTEGKTIITNAVIGLLIIFFSYTLTSIFLQFFASIAKS